MKSGKPLAHTFRILLELLGSHPEDKLMLTVVICLSMHWIKGGKVEDVLHLIPSAVPFPLCF